MDSEATKLNLLGRMVSDETCSEPTDLSLSLLKTITKDFSDDLQIGRGGFAVVYKGFLGNGRTVAVKKLFDSIDLDEAKYNHEVNCLMRVRHQNIVRFLGYCADTHGKVQDYKGKFVMADVRHRLLCFEYLPNGSLHHYITDASHGLEWRERYKILKGICRGLCHLHELRIVHLDLKPANILLDDNMVPKICDFGVSRCFDENQTRTITSRQYGSWGYLAPEFHSGVITFTSDIYSLGVIFTEMLTGKKGYSPVEDVLQNWRNRFDISSADTLLEQVRVCAQISIDCMNFDPDKRPGIHRIIQILDETEGTDDFMGPGMSTSLLPQLKDMAERLPPDQGAYDGSKGKQVHVPNGIEMHASIYTSMNGIHLQNETVSAVSTPSLNMGRASHPNGISSQHKSPGSISENSEVSAHNHRVSGHPDAENFNTRGHSSSDEMLNASSRADDSSSKDARSPLNGEDGYKSRSAVSIPRNQVQAEWIEQYEPGVYITLTSLGDGTRDLKRIRFSRRRFGEHQAERWWNENRDKVYDKYNVRSSERVSSASSIRSAR